MGKLHQIIGWVPAAVVTGIGILLGAAQIWSDIKAAIDPVEVFVMGHYIASATFLVAAVALWYWALTRTTTPGPAEAITMGDTYNNDGNIFGNMGPSYYGKQPFEMTEAVMKQVLAATSGWQTVGVAPLGLNPQSAIMSDALCRYLSGHGRDARRVGAVGMIPGAYGPLFIGKGSVTGDITPYSNDKIIYVNADG